MANWILPHEMEEDPVMEQASRFNYVMPHEVEQREEATVSPEKELLQSMPGYQRAAIGAGKVASDIGRGVKQTAGMVRNLFPGEPSKWPEEVAEAVRSERGARQALAEDPAAQLGIGLGMLGANVAMPGGTKAIPSLTQLALGGAALEGPLKAREEPTWGNMLTEGGQGALYGGLGGGLTSALASGLGRSKNALAGRFSNPEHQNRLRIFKGNRVPASLGDITQNPNVLALEDTLKFIPLSGRKDFLQRQSERIGDVVREAPERIAGVTPGSTKEDIGSTLVKSIRDKYAANKQMAKGLYDAVSARVQAVGAPPVPTSELASETNKLLSRYPTAFAKLTDDPATVKTLQEIASGTSPQASTILGANGKPIMKAPQLSFDELRQLDSDLGALIRQGRTLSARGEYNSKTFSQLVEVQNALRKDIENWATSVGDPAIAKGVKEANKYFKESVVPFRKNPTTRKVIHGEDVNQDTLADQMFKLDSPWLSEQSQGFLTPEGIQAGRYHLIKKAEQNAMSDVLSSGYSPSAFLRASKLGETGPKLFSPNEIGQLEDLQELIRSGRRAADYKFNPATGASLWGAVAGKMPVVPLAAKAANKLTTSEPAMRFMLADPRMYTGSGGLGKASEAIVRRSGSGAALSAIDDQQ